MEIRIYVSDDLNQLKSITWEGPKNTVLSDFNAWLRWMSQKERTLPEQWGKKDK